MTIVDPKVSELYHLFRALPEPSKRQFMSLIKATQSAEEKDKPESPTAVIGLFYTRIASKLYSYQGIKLLPLDALRKTEVEAELAAALKWLKNGKKVSRETLNGLMEMAAEAVARQIPYRSDGRNSKAMVFDMHRKLLSNIPKVVDDAFPGYHVNGILHQIAERVGKGEMPLQKLEGEDE